MRVLDLFAGLRGWSAPWEARGHEVFSIDLDERFDVSLHADVLTLIDADLPWRPDVILASPPCEAFSVMTIGRNWTEHREPKSDKARLALRLVEATIGLIHATRPAFWVIENPRAMLRTQAILHSYERRTVTYCQYGEPYMKPTDLWGGFPPSLTLRPMCSPRSACHVASPRGSTTGIQGDGAAVFRCPACGARNRLPAETCACGFAIPGWAGSERTSATFRGGFLETMARYPSWSDQWHRTALRAKIPEQLSIEICQAAERDIAVGYAPSMLWEAAWQ